MADIRAGGRPAPPRAAGRAGHEMLRSSGTGGLTYRKNSRLRPESRLVNSLTIKTRILDLLLGRRRAGRSATTATAF
ncbi:hypothetical protein EVAR_17332_1 [Eumeta japonica]|uniref:Uncharacterized protein n=1 Tax=Eumeta variegata TaxID=151549 RepID=A0A4C1TTT1_EUMVA|nr:hypothetical protein EVAR_17332_1 [Eumeta japonica]